MADPFSALLVAPRLPSPLGKADSRTVYHMIEFLASRGHRVHLATFVEPDAEPSRRQRLGELCASVAAVPLRSLKSRAQLALGLMSAKPMQVWYYRDTAMQEAVDQIIEQHAPDVLYGHLFRMGQYLRHHTEHPAKLLGMQISYILNYRRLIETTERWWEKLFYTVEHRKVKQYEPSLIPDFERVLYISPSDKEAVDPRDQFDNVFFNPHGIEVDYYAEDLGLEKDPHAIVFNADFEPPTNVDAALFFYEKIFPQVRRAVPEAKLWLAGRKPPGDIRALSSDPAVTITGFVEDLRPYLQQAAVAIDPLRVGAGLQNKVLVSMAAGLPVVATRVANEGIQIPEGEAILVADEPETFAEQVIRLLGDEEERGRIGKNAHDFVSRYWTWAYHFQKFEAMVQRLFREGAEAEIEQYYPLEEEPCVPQ